MVQVPWSELCDLMRQHGTWRRTHVPWRIIRYLKDLIRNGLGHFWASVANLHAPHSSRAVYQFFTILIIEINPFCFFGKHAFFLPYIFHVFPWMYEILVVKTLDFFNFFKSHFQSPKELALFTAGRGFHGVT